MRTQRKYRYARTVLAIAVLSAFGAAHAQDATVAQLTSPDAGYVGVGAAAVSGDSGDRSLFGQYRGIRRDDAFFLLDFGYVKRDEATGTWTVIEARNLGMENREIRGLYGPQGNWKVYGEYTEIVRRDPRTVNTSLEGAGTTTPIVSLLPVRGTGSDLELKTERKRLGLGFEKHLGRNLSFEANFTNEDKDGARPFGRGFTCPSGAAPTPVCTALASGANQWAILFLPRPVNSQTRQIEAKVNYVGERLALTAGYYGSFYNNDNGSLTPTVNGNLNNPLNNPMGVGGGVELTAGLRGILELPMAMPPDSQAHQFSIAGNYRIAPTTITTFKYARTRATQDDSFESAGLSGAPGGRDNLGGVLVTTLGQLGISARPMPKLQVGANVRYADREDKTPIEEYNVEGTSFFTNGHISNRKISGKLDASYELPANFRGTAGLDYETIDRGEFVETSEVAGLSAIRRKMYERGFRLELRRSMSDNLTGFVSLVSSKRVGSTWLKPSGGEGVIPADPDCVSQGRGQPVNSCAYSDTGIFPYHMEDRRRDKVRVLADWSPVDRLSLQFGADWGKDKYDAPTMDRGLSKTNVRLASVDASYAMSDDWRLMANYSYGEQTLKIGHSNGYLADLKDRNTTVGIGVAGKATPRLRVGADLLYINDRNIYGQSPDELISSSNVAFLEQSGGLPDVTYRDVRLRLHGTYALQKNADLSLEIVHDRTKLDEWTWGYNGVAFAFSDNTTVTLNPNQRVTYVSLMYTYRFR